MRKRILIVILLFAFQPVISLFGRDLSAHSASYQSELAATAANRKLHDAQYWRLLLHYESTLFGWESEVDDPAFFLAADGKTNPTAELHQTLAAFFKPVLAGLEEEHPQCLFPARFAWLSEQLNFQTEKMPSPKCQQYRKWLHEVDAKSVTLIFPNYYIDAPASMFGHTLLRLNTARPVLLNYAVNYAALVDDEQTGTIEYGFKGIFGGFKGVFTIAPYYLSVRSYNDMELRDIWEYDLDFSPEEVQRMIRHLWELKRIYFDYYFFRENCSFHLLSLLEAARPGLRLRQRYSLWTTPTDTLHDINTKPGMISRRNYRPSRWSLFRQRIAAMDDTERQLSISIIQTENLVFTSKWGNLPLESRARILDLLLAYYALHPSEISEHLRENALAKRAALQTILPPARHLPVSSPPETGHRTTMVSLSSGHEGNGSGFTEISLRLSLQGLLDRESGFIPNSGVELFHTKVRRYGDTDTTRLQELTLARIISISARNGIDSGFSWKLDTGWRQALHSDCRDCLFFVFNPGGGVGFSVPGGIFYTMGDFRYSNGAGFAPAGHAALGLTMGYLSNQIGYWKGHLASTFSYPAYDSRLPDLRQSTGLSYSPLRNHALRFEWQRDNDFTEAQIGYRFFF